MQTLHWIAIVSLCVWLAEGVTLAVFPAQVRRLLSETDPQTLHVAGLVEALLAAGLMAYVLAM